MITLIQIRMVSGVVCKNPTMVICWWTKVAAKCEASRCWSNMPRLTWRTEMERATDGSAQLAWVAYGAG